MGIFEFQPCNGFFFISFQWQTQNEPFVPWSHRLVFFGEWPWHGGIYPISGDFNALNLIQGQQKEKTQTSGWWLIYPSEKYCIPKSNASDSMNPPALGSKHRRSIDAPFAWALHESFHVQSADWHPSILRAIKALLWILAAESSRAWASAAHSCRTSSTGCMPDPQKLCHGSSTWKPLWWQSLLPGHQLDALHRPKETEEAAALPSRFQGLIHSLPPSLAWVEMHGQRHLSAQSIGMIIPNIWENKKCSKPPTRTCIDHTWDNLETACRPKASVPMSGLRRF